MSGAIIAYRNRVDRLVPGETLTATGDVHPNYPLSNLQRRQLSAVAKVWPTAPVGGPNRIVCDFGEILDFRIVALLGIESVDMAAGWAVVQVQYSRDGVTWYTADVDIAEDAGAPGLPMSAILILGRDATDLTQPAQHKEIGFKARYVRVAPGWISTDADGWRSIGRLWIGDALILPNGVDARWQQGVLEFGQLDTSAGRQAYENPAARSRTLMCPLSKLDTMQAFGFDEGDTSAADVPCIQSLQLDVGATGEVIVLPRTSSSIWMRRLGIYGHLAKPPTIAHESGPYFFDDATRH